MPMQIKLTLAFVLLLYTPYSQAATELPWEWTMVIVAGISAIIATFLAKNNDKADGLGLKILLGGLYFWIAVFAQTMVLMLLYHFLG